MKTIFELNNQITEYNGIELRDLHVGFNRIFVKDTDKLILDSDGLPTYVFTTDDTEVKALGNAINDIVTAYQNMDANDRYTHANSFTQFKNLLDGNDLESVAILALTTNAPYLSSSLVTNLISTDPVFASVGNNPDIKPDKQLCLCNVPVGINVNVNALMPIVNAFIEGDWVDNNNSTYTWNGDEAKFIICRFGMSFGIANNANIQRPSPQTRIEMQVPNGAWVIVGTDTGYIRDASDTEEDSHSIFRRVVNPIKGTMFRVVSVREGTVSGTVSAKEGQFELEAIIN